MSRQTIKEFARSGGTSTFNKYGSEHMAEMARKGHKVTLERDPDFYKKLAAAGLKARQAKREEVKKSNRTSGQKILDFLTKQG